MSTIKSFHRLYIVILLVTWGFLMTVLVRRNYFQQTAPVFYADLETGIREIPSDAQWMIIYHNGQKMGYSIYSINNRGAKGYTIQSTAQLIMGIAGMETQVLMRNSVSVDSLFHLTEFDFSLQSEQYTTHLSGIKAGTELAVTFYQGLDSTVQILTVPEKLYTYIGVQPLITWQGFKEGDQVSLPSFDPVSMEVGEITVTHLGKETITIAEVDYNLNKIGLDFRGIPSTMWLDDDGITYREESLMGLVMERSSSADALAVGKEGLGIDMMDAFAIPVKPHIAGNRLSELTLEITGLEPAVLENLVTDRQQIIQLDPLTIRLRSVPVKANKKEAHRFLGGTEIIQPMHPRIQALVSELLPPDISLAERVSRLHQFVYSALRKYPVVSMSSAVEILDNRTGDCSEHTVLFTTLARGAGIPTKIHIGLVHLNGQFVYHAWPVVYLEGEWVSIDPTLNQDVADATHLTLLETDFTNLSSLMPILGQVTITVIDQLTRK